MLDVLRLICGFPVRGWTVRLLLYIDTMHVSYNSKRNLANLVRNFALPPPG